MKIAVIRRNSGENTIVCKILSDLRISFSDISYPSNIYLEILDSKDYSPICFLNDNPLSSFDKIIYLGYPSTIKKNFPSADEIFILQERTQAFLACFYCLDKKKIINSGYVFRWNKTVMNESLFKRYFASLEIKILEEVMSNHSVFRESKFENNKYLILVKRQSNIFSTNNQLERKIFQAGLSFLIEFDLDWCVIFYCQDTLEISRVIVDFSYLSYEITKQILQDLLCC
ncbi:hypothetical protein [Chryseobacterium sp. KCF3-3]|uniref:hypothetical protein n=1 Tax=Chryseobacterium sp. KCF3-3 TaxID=3231511 RepID=UPI0038B360FA